MTRAFRLLLFLLLFGTLTAAPCPPELATAFDEEVLRAGASPEDILQYEAQVQQESGCLQYAESKYAQGPTQFTPDTRSDWYPRTTPSCEDAHWSEPNCAFRAQILYMTVLRRSYATSPDAWPLAQAGYNGGPGWIKRERRLCAATPGCNPRLWWGHIEKHCHPKRAARFCKQNRDYPIYIRRWTERLRSK